MFSLLGITPSGIWNKLHGNKYIPTHKLFINTVNANGINTLPRQTSPSFVLCMDGGYVYSCSQQMVQMLEVFQPLFEQQR